MGFFDELLFTYYASPLPELVEGTKEVAKKAGEKIVEKYNDVSADYNETSERCSEWSDEELIRKYKNCSNNIKKLAYYGELKNRGYFDNDNEE